jgi:hypothetical protein
MRPEMRLGVKKTCYQRCNVQGLQANISTTKRLGLKTLLHVTDRKRIKGQEAVSVS